MQIGKVTLDLTLYPGEDYYCDGSIEDELLEIVKTTAPEDFQEVIEQRANWPVLYHLSSLRGNIMDWFPMPKNAKILEIGSGCGAITRTLAKKGGSVTCVDLSKKRSMINAYRNKDLENICIKVGNFQEIEPTLDCDYDVICLIGVFEYANAYIGGEAPYEEFLRIIMKHRKAGGQVVIAIENRLGLKYFAGCREDHLGDFFSGIEGYPEGGAVRTFSRRGLEKIFARCNETNYQFYYPYPDYKFPHTIYSDARLPQKGELTSSLRNFDRGRLLLFDEAKAFDAALEEEEFPIFSNSYFVVLGGSLPIIYSRFSNDRMPEYRIRTDILEDGEKRKVKKLPLSEAARAHERTILEAYEALKKRYAESDLQICSCQKEKDGLVFPYFEGNTLEELLDRCLEREDQKQLEELLKRYFDYVSYNWEGQATDLDFIFPNVLVNQKKEWMLIDYEWTTMEAVEPEKVIQRGLFCYCLGAEKRKKILKTVEQLGFGVGDSEALWQEEMAFQNKVTGNHASLSQMRDLIHNEVLPLKDAIAVYEEQGRRAQIQIYYDEGQGFCEEHSFLLAPQEIMREQGVYGPEREGAVTVNIPVKPEWRQLRFDPAREPIILAVEKIKLIGEGKSWLYEEAPLTSGVALGERLYGFSHEDPSVTISLAHEGLQAVEITYQQVTLPKGLAAQLATNQKTGALHAFKRIITGKHS